ncbi:MAG: hypothetical protein KJ957_02275 [Candidatus Omnitrophica bacterium]|nr:hypothetical protein [Candidatus Omnitrophota bacterium]
MIKRINLLLFICLIYASFPDGICASERENGKYVFAHYMAWYGNKETSGQWFNWAIALNSIPEDKHHYPDYVDWRGRKDIASSLYPLIGPYDSTDEDVLEYHILLAKAAGIDGFMVNWYGFSKDQDVINQNDISFKKLLRLSEKLDFKICVCFDDKSMFPPYNKLKTRKEVIKNTELTIKRFNKKYSSYRSYFRIKDRVVFSNFSHSEPSDSVDSPGFSADEYALLLQPYNYFLMHDFHWYLSEDYFGVSDAMFPWLEQNFHQLEDFYKRSSVELEKARIRFISGLVSPGFDNTGCWGWGTGPHITYRNGLSHYSLYWEHVIRHDPGFIQIVTWNDFPEGSVLEPTKEFKNTYLFETLKQIARYKDFNPDYSGLTIPARIYNLRKLANGAKKNRLPFCRNYTKKLKRSSKAFLDKDYTLAKISLDSLYTELESIYSRLFSAEINELMRGLKDKKKLEKNRIILSVLYSSVIEELIDFSDEKLEEILSERTIAAFILDILEEKDIAFSEVERIVKYLLRYGDSEILKDVISYLCFNDSSSDEFMGKIDMIFAERKRDIRPAYFKDYLENCDLQSAVQLISRLSQAANNTFKTEPSYSEELRELKVLLELKTVQLLEEMNALKMDTVDTVDMVCSVISPTSPKFCNIIARAYYEKKDMEKFFQVMKENGMAITIREAFSEPVIDGIIEPEEWKEAVSIDEFYRCSDGEKVNLKMKAWIARDARYIYVASECYEPFIKELKASHVIRDDKNLWKDDCLELFFDTGYSLKSFKQILVNTKGNVLDLILKDGIPVYDWDGDYNIGTSVTKEKWSVEIAIPLSLLKNTRISKGEIWGFNLSISRHAKENEQCQWVSTYGHTHKPWLFGVIRFE